MYAMTNESTINNIMSVDLEDYFCDLPFSTWPKYESRLLQTTQTLLDLFEKHKVKATFFVLGYLAEKFPELIKNIYDKGHEIGSHSYSHPDLRTITKEQFEEDLVKSLKILEKITGEPILGFRAPYFSVNRSNYWVFDVLRKYVKYDSSIFPVKTKLYGVPEAPREIYHPSQSDFTKIDQSQSFLELPPSTYHILKNFNLPIAGGFFFRFFPYFFLKRGFEKLKKQKRPIIFYIHPKDLDPDMPKIEEYSWDFYYGKKNVVKKFDRLLSDFKFTTAKKVLEL